MTETHARRYGFRSLLGKSLALSLVVMGLAVLVPSVVLGLHMKRDIRKRIDPTLEAAIATAWGKLYRIHGTDFSVKPDGTFLADGAPVNGDFSAVDAVRRTIFGMAGTATIFARIDTPGGTPVFCRVATNVPVPAPKTAPACEGVPVGEDNARRPDGHFRATGTMLETGNAAYRAIMAGERYKGRIEILGEPYFTIYEPIFGENELPAGILYVGIKEAEFYAAVDTARRVIVVTALLTAGVLTLVLIFLYRRMFDPVRRLTRSLLRLDSGETDVEIPGRARADEVGDMARAVATLRQNRIERDRLARQQAETQDRLRHAMKMEAVGTLAGGIAHGFYNILTGIMGHCTLLKEDLPEDAEEARDSVDQIHQATSRAVGQVRQLLEFARRKEPVRELLDPVEVTGEVMQLAKASVPKRIALDWRPETDVPDICADSDQIHQLLLNLIYNAADAIGEARGAITVRVWGKRLFAPLPVTGGDLPAGDYAVLEVADTGSGMDAATRRRVFDPFFTTKETGKGTGLGLASVLGVAQTHEAGVTVESAPGRGTRFSIYFPAASTETC